MVKQKPVRARKQESAGSFTDAERAAMQERARELRAASRRRASATPEEGEADVLAKIAEMKEPDRTMAARLHDLIKTAAPVLAPRTWYGMPAYAKDGKVLCFFQSGQKFKTRYATLGFSDQANLDEGAFWPVVFALNNMTAAEEAKISALLKKAVG
jgi:uncharacterized protein YdhG (YjbR/CyaY superfamily)